MKTKEKLIDWLVGMLIFAITITLLSIGISFPKSFLITGLLSLAATLILTSTKSNGYKLVRIHAPYLFFVLIGLNSWEFLWLPLILVTTSAAAFFIKKRIQTAMPLRIGVLVSELVLIAAITLVFMPAQMQNAMKIDKSEISTKPVTEIIVKKLDGKPIDKNYYKGKIIVLDFWATWCKPCREEFIELNDVYQKLKNDPEVAFLFISTESPNRISAFKQESAYNFPFFQDGGGQFSKQMNISKLPTLMVIDKNGKIQYIHNGYMKGTGLAKQLLQEIESLK